jgi:hypothetical protein
MNQSSQNNALASNHAKAETKKPHHEARLSVGTEPAFDSLLRWHSDAAVQSNDFCIHVRVGDAVNDREREFLSATQTLGEQH